MLTKTAIFAGLAAAATFVLLSAAFAARLPVRAYTTSDGLAHDRVNKVVRDSRGFIWFCTSEGLSRFDGYEFRNYTQRDGLPHRGVRDFLETRAGQMFAATGNGVVAFDPLGGSGGSKIFTTLDSENAGDHPNGWDISDLFEDRRGRIWAGTSDGLYYLDPADKELRLRRFDSAAFGIDMDDVTALLEDRSGAMWVGGQFGLYRLLSDGSVEVLDRDRIRAGLGAIFEDSGGSIWVGTNGGESSGLYKFSLEGDGRSARLDRRYDSRDGLISDHWINQIFETSDGRMLFVLSSGLCEFDRSPDAAKPFKVLMKGEFISMGEDPGGNVWVGTASAGTYRIARNGFVSYDESDGLKARAAASIVQGSDGKTYVIAGGAITRFDGDHFTAVMPLRLQAANWGIGQVTFQDHAGEWWTTGSALQRYPAATRLEELAHTGPRRTYTSAEGLSANSVFQLYEDSRGDIWIGLLGAQTAVNRWERATDTIRGFTAEDGFPGVNCPTAFGEDRQGNVWMGFYTGAIGRFRNGRFEVFRQGRGNSYSPVRDIYVDAGGRLWIATYIAGVLRVDDPTAEHPVLTDITTADGLASDQANCVTEDRFGRLYIGTGRGVDRLDPVNGRHKVFTTADGLRENLVTLCSRAPDGALWFGTAQGPSRYVPTAEERSPPPPVFIASVSANGVPAKELSQLGESGVSGVELASDQRQVQIGFFALGFATGERLRYQYKIDGTGTEWTEPSTDRQVSMTLAPGGYRFLVRAVTADGVLSERPAEVAFTIGRPLWQRWWFLLTAAVGLAALIYLLYSYRLRRLVEIEKVRTRIATDLHDDVGAGLSKIAILSEVVNQRIDRYGNGDELHKPLDDIAGTSRELVDSMSDIVWAINPERDNLHDLLQRMRSLAGEMCELADVSLRFSIDDSASAPTMPVPADLRRESFLIFKEALNNVIKHSGADKATVDVGRDGEYLTVCITDNGRGFQRDGDAESNGGGNGLPNMRRRAANFGGTCEIISTPGEGTTVLIRVPLDNSRRLLSIGSIFRKR